MNISETEQLYVNNVTFKTLKFFNCDVIYNIEWTKRFSKRLADATYYHSKNYGRFRFSSIIWPYVPNDERWNVIIHEVCHIVDSQHHAKARDMGYKTTNEIHGQTWKKLMIQAGAVPSRVWQPDFETSMKILQTTNKFCVEAFCDCKVHMITKNRATRIKNGSKYNCIYCNSFINLDK